VQATAGKHPYVAWGVDNLDEASFAASFVPYKDYFLNQFDDGQHNAYKYDWKSNIDR
jgi:hypothetical protein